MRRVKVAIVDYCVGNLRSLQGALLRVGAEPTVTKDPGEIRKSEGMVLPGVGAFRTAVGNLDFESVLGSMSSGVPVLRICLGLQLLSQAKKEGW